MWSCFGKPSTSGESVAAAAPKPRSKTSISTLSSVPTRRLPPGNKTKSATKSGSSFAGIDSKGAHKPLKSDLRQRTHTSQLIKVESIVRCSVIEKQHLASPIKKTDRTLKKPGTGIQVRPQSSATYIISHPRSYNRLPVAPSSTKKPLQQASQVALIKASKSAMTEHRGPPRSKDHKNALKNRPMTNAPLMEVAFVRNNEELHRYLDRDPEYRLQNKESTEFQLPHEILRVSRIRLEKMPSFPFPTKTKMIDKEQLEKISCQPSPTEQSRKHSDTINARRPEAVLLTNHIEEVLKNHFEDGRTSRTIESKTSVKKSCSNVTGSKSVTAKAVLPRTRSLMN